MEKTPAELEVVLQYFADFSPVQLQQFAALQELYTEWNAKINVISRKDIGSLYERHILHSLAIAAAFEFTPGMDIIDIGTGGGFPGIPLAIFFPDVRFHLVDSIGKKIKVVEAVAEGIGLTNVTAQHGRAEEIKGRKFDVAVSRAVAPLGTLWTWARPLLRKPKTPAVPPSPASSSPDVPAASSPASSSPASLSPAVPASSPPASPSPGTRAMPAADQPSHNAPATSIGRIPDNPRTSASASKLDRSLERSLLARPLPSGLICLKGGDLAAEISDSGLRPRIMEIHDIFPLDSFREKYLLQVPF